RGKASVQHSVRRQILSAWGPSTNRWSRRQWRTHLRARPSRKHDGGKIRLNWIRISRRIWCSRIGMERLDERQRVGSYSCESNRFGHEERLGKRRQFRRCPNHEGRIPGTHRGREEAHPPRLIPSFKPSTDITVVEKIDENLQRCARQNTRDNRRTYAERR